MAVAAAGLLAFFQGCNEYKTASSPGGPSLRISSSIEKNSGESGGISLTHGAGKGHYASSIVIVHADKITAGERWALGTLRSSIRKKYALYNDAFSDIQKVNESSYRKNREKYEGLTPLYLGNVQANQDLVFSPQDSDGSFRISIQKSGIRLKGKTDMGTEFSAYTFLEDYLGFRWYGYDFFENNVDEAGNALPLMQDILTHYPRRKIFLVRPEKNKIFSPSFQFRSINSGGNLWERRMKMNVTSSYAAANPKNSLSSSFVTWPAAPHSFTNFLSLDDLRNLATLGKASQNDEACKYGATKSCFRFSKFDLSDPAFQRKLQNGIGQYIREASGKHDMVPLFPMDGASNFPELQDPSWDFGGGPISRRMLEEKGFLYFARRHLNFDNFEVYRTMSPRYTNFYSTAIQNLRREFPDQWFITQSYVAYTLPPAQPIQARPLDDKVINLICRFEGQETALVDSRRDDKNPFSYKLKEAIEGWKAYYKNIGIREYYAKGIMMSLPFPNVETIKKDIRYYKSAGIKMIYGMASDKDSAINGLNYYVAAKLQWNPGLNVSLLVRSYFENMYGPAKEEFSESYRCLQDQLSPAPYAMNFPKEFQRYYDYKKIGECRKIAESGLEKIKGNVDLPSIELKRYKLRAWMFIKSLTYAYKFGFYLSYVDRMIKESNLKEGESIKDLSRLKNSEKILSLRDDLRNFILKNSGYRIGGFALDKNTGNPVVDPYIENNYLNVAKLVSSIRNQEQ